MRKHTLLLTTSLLLLLLISACTDQDIEIKQSEVDIFKQRFSLDTFNKQADLNFFVDWSDFQHLNLDSIQYYEFEVKDTTFRNTQTHGVFDVLSHKLLIVDDFTNNPAFYILKLSIDSNDKSIVESTYLQTSESNLTGLVNWYNEEGTLVRLEVYQKGQLMEAIEDEEELINPKHGVNQARCGKPSRYNRFGSSKTRIQGRCGGGGGGGYVTVTTHHYTDWYTVVSTPSGVSISFSHTTYNGSTTSYVYVEGDIDTSSSSTSYGNTQGGSLHPRYIEAAVNNESVICNEGYLKDENGNCIINQLIDPCLSDVADKVLNMNLDDDFNNIIQEAFNSSDDVNLIIRDDQIFSNQNAVGRAEISESWGTINVNIFLNADRLPNYTKELIAATIYHEAFHALFFYFDINQDYQSSPTEYHINFFNNYIHALGNSMISAFPSLSDRDALGLILKGVLAYKKDWGDMYDEILEKNNFTEDELKSIRDAYRDGTLGTPCN